MSPEPSGDPRRRSSESPSPPAVAAGRRRRRRDRSCRRGRRAPLRAASSREVASALAGREAGVASAVGSVQDDVAGVAERRASARRGSPLRVAASRSPSRRSPAPSPPASGRTVPARITGSTEERAALGRIAAALLVEALPGPPAGGRPRRRRVRELARPSRRDVARRLRDCGARRRRTGEAPAAGAGAVRRRRSADLRPASRRSSPSRVAPWRAARRSPRRSLRPRRPRGRIRSGDSAADNRPPASSVPIRPASRRMPARTADDEAVDTSAPHSPASVAAIESRSSVPDRGRRRRSWTAPMRAVISLRRLVVEDRCTPARARRRRGRRCR